MTPAEHAMRSCLAKYQNQIVGPFHQLADGDWNYFCSYFKIPEDCLREYHTYLNWKVVSFYQKLSEQFICDFADKLHWEYVSMKQQITAKIAENYSSRLDWRHLSKKNLGLEFFEKFIEFVDWTFFLHWQKVNEEFVLKHLNVVKLDLNKNYLKKICFNKNWNWDRIAEAWDMLELLE